MRLKILWCGCKKFLYFVTLPRAFPVSHLLCAVSWSKAWGWAGKSRWKSSFIQINSDFSSKIEIVDDAYRKKCIWMMILFVMNLMIASSWPKNQALNFIVCFQLWFLFFTTRSSSSILGFSVAFSRENCVSNLNCSTTEMGRQMTFKKL